MGLKKPMKFKCSCLEHILEVHTSKHDTWVGIYDIYGRDIYGKEEKYERPKLIADVLLSSLEAKKLKKHMR